MRLQKWITLLLIITMTLTLLCSCKSTEDEEASAVVDEWVGVKDTDSQEEQESEKEETPQEDESEEIESEEETPEESDPEEETPKEDAPKEENPKEEEVGEEEIPEETDQPAVKKESSGTSITFIIQNLYHGGSSFGEKGDGTGNNLYNRTRRFKSMVETHDADVILTQEARRGWVAAFEDEALFANTYEMLYLYRSEDSQEATPLLYKKDKYTLLESGHFWLSETPNVSSPSYADDEGARISTWVHLQDKNTGAKFYAYSTHFGFAADGPIRSQAQYIDLFNNMKKNEYAFVGGDWNVAYRDADYHGMMEWDSIIDLRDMAMNLYEDGLCELGGMMYSGNAGYNDETNNMPHLASNGTQIDYLMMKPHPNVGLDYYGFDYNIYDYAADGVQKGNISDHFGVVVKLRIGTDADYSQYQVEHDYGNNPIYVNAPA